MSKSKSKKMKLKELTRTFSQVDHNSMNIYEAGKEDTSYDIVSTPKKWKNRKIKSVVTDPNGIIVVEVSKKKKKKKFKSEIDKDLNQIMKNVKHIDRGEEEKCVDITRDEDATRINRSRKGNDDHHKHHQNNRNNDNQSRQNNGQRQNRRRSNRNYQSNNQNTQNNDSSKSENKDSQN